jgi:hypothetical protein
MDDTDWYAERFERHRPHCVPSPTEAGPPTEAEDAVQEAWPEPIER